MKKYLFIVLTVGVGFGQGLFDYFSDSNWKEELYEISSPAITLVESYLNGELIGFGSGVNVDSEGEVITNYHVVQGADQVWISFKNGERHLATHYKIVEPSVDFVIVNLLADNLPTVELGNSDEMKIGQDVVAIGNPHGQWSSLTSGIISQIVYIEGFEIFQTDVTIAPGSSGGALFNKEMEVIGITTSGLDKIDINFAIPAKYIQLGRLMASKGDRKKWIGFDKPKSKPKYEPKKETTSTSKKNNNGTTSTAQDDPGALTSIISCYCMYLFILGLLPRG